MTPRLLLLAGLALGLALPSWAAPRPVAAVVLEVQGQATVLLHPASRAARPALFGQRLRVEAVVEVPDGSRVSLGFYRDGSEVVLTGPVRVEVQADAAGKLAGSGTVAPGARSRLDLPASAPEPVPGGAVLRAGAAPLAGAMLVQVLWSDRPGLRWQPLSGATYRVRVLKPGGEELAAWTTEVPSVEPAALVAHLGGPLEWGQEYEWEVSARLGGRLVGRTSRTLRVLPREEAAAVARAILGAAPADRASRLALAERLTSLGLWEEALAFYEDLWAGEPANPELRSRVREARLGTGRLADLGEGGEP